MAWPPARLAATRACESQSRMEPNSALPVFAVALRLRGPVLPFWIDRDTGLPFAEPVRSSNHARETPQLRWPAKPPLSAQIYCASRRERSPCAVDLRA